ncbi:MAG: hypothetical protein P4N41_19480 [Negativicutes bacterium]|nr:hypothetical protein [Negativicutes bacterium]
MNREEVKKILLAQAWDEVVRLALVDRSILRTLFGLLYDADDYIHWLAIEAIGRVGGATAASDEEKTREMVRRLLWNLNDESGGTPWGSVGAIGAIAASRPDLFGHYLSQLFPFHEDVSFAAELIWAVVLVGRHRPELAEEYIPFLFAAMGHDRPAIRGYAAWAAGALALKEAGAPLACLQSDHTPVAVYLGQGMYVHTTIAALAADSAAKL